MVYKKLNFNIIKDYNTYLNNKEEYKDIIDLEL